MNELPENMAWVTVNDSYGRISRLCDENGEIYLVVTQNVDNTASFNDGTKHRSFLTLDEAKFAGQNAVLNKREAKKTQIFSPSQFNYLAGFVRSMGHYHTDIDIKSDLLSASEALEYAGKCLYGNENKKSCIRGRTGYHAAATPATHGRIHCQSNVCVTPH